MKKQFIRATTEYSTAEKHIPAPYLRRGFDLSFRPEQASIKVCGLGFYRLFVNGLEITKGFLAPYLSNPDHYCYYDEYDLLPYLKKGKNAIGLILGNGMMNAVGGGIWDFDKRLGAPRPVSRWNWKRRQRTNGFLSLPILLSARHRHRSALTISVTENTMMRVMRLTVGIYPILMTVIGILL